MTPEELTQIIISFLETGEEQYTTEGVNDILKANPDFKTLDLKGYNFNNVHFQKMAEILKTNTSLTTLYLPEISVNGMKAIGSALESNQHLRTLELNYGDKNISREKVLTKVVKANQTLTSLNLENCHFTIKQIKEIVKALENNHSLVQLVIPNNRSHVEVNDEWITWNDEGSKELNMLLDEKTKLLERNIELLENFASKLFDIEKKNPINSNFIFKENSDGIMENTFKLKSPINLSLNSLAYFRDCDKEQLIIHSSENKQFFNKLAEVYLNHNFYENNFFKLAKVCNNLQAKDKGKTGIYDLPKIIIKKIVSYLLFEEYKFKLDFSDKEKKVIPKRELESYEQMPLNTTDKKAKFQESNKASVLSTENFKQLLLYIKDSLQIKEAITLITKMKKHELLGQDNEGKTALHWATYYGKEEIVKILIAKQPDLILLVDKEDNSALVLALVEKHNNIAQLLANYSICNNNNNHQVDNISTKGKEEKDEENHTNDVLSLHENQGLSGDNSNIFEDNN
jgi:hypothetical protein